MKFQELMYGDCPHCGYREIAFKFLWSLIDVPSNIGGSRAWATMACPRCGGVALLRMTAENVVSKTGMIPPPTDVHTVVMFPSLRHERYQIEHLPEAVEEYFRNAMIVLAAGVPSAAAVELRRTLEAAAAHVGISNGRLVEQVQKLIDENLITRQFSGALDHVRKIGNAGAHHTDDRLSVEDVELAARFTEQLLRNLFEVPGELEKLKQGQV